MGSGCGDNSTQSTAKLQKALNINYLNELLTY